MVGIVCRSIGAVDKDGGKFMRVKVNLDIYLPLRQGWVVSLKKGAKTWVSFKYERLPNICYWCGRLDHGDKDCPLWIQSKGSLTAKQRQFSQFLCTSLYINKSIIFVLGFYDNVAITFATSEDRRLGGWEEGGDSDTSLPLVNPNPVMEMDTHEEVISAKLNAPLRLHFLILCIQLVITYFWWQLTLSKRGLMKLFWETTNPKLKEGIMMNHLQVHVVA